MLDVLLLQALGASQTELRQFTLNHCRSDDVPCLFFGLISPTPIERFLAIRKCSVDKMSELVALMTPLTSFEYNWVLLCLTTKLFFGKNEI